MSTAGRSSASHPGAAVVFQNFALYPWLTVEQNVRVGLQRQGPRLPEEEAASRVRACDRPGRPLRASSEAYPKELSGRHEAARRDRAGARRRAGAPLHGRAVLRARRADGRARCAPRCTALWSERASSLVLKSILHHHAPDRGGGITSATGSSSWAPIPERSHRRSSTRCPTRATYRRSRRSFAWSRRSTTSSRGSTCPDGEADAGRRGRPSVRRADPADPLPPVPIARSSASSRSSSDHGGEHGPLRARRDHRLRLRPHDRRRQGRRDARILRNTRRPRAGDGPRPGDGGRARVGQEAVVP